MILVDNFTKYIWIRSLPDKKARTVASAVWHICADFGIPKILQSDNGKEFVNSVLRELLQVMHVDHRLTSPYHPRGNGLVERSVHTILTTVKKSLQGCRTSWAQHIAATQLFYNLKIAESSRTSPFVLMFGRPFSEFQDFCQAADEFLTTDNRQQQFAYITNIVWPAVANNQSMLSHKRAVFLDKTRHTITSPYPEGSAVMLKNLKRAQKTDALWLGPYTIVRCNRGGAYTLQHQDGTILPRDVPPSHLKFLTDHPKDYAGDDIYQISKVLNHRKNGNKYEYLVRWHNYTGEHDSWVPYEDFIETDTITEYWRRTGHTTPHQP